MTDRMKDRMTEEGIHSLRVGWRIFFQLYRCVSFWFWQEIVFGVTYVLRVQYSCGIVIVFWFWREIVFYVAYLLRVQYSYAVVSVFWLRQGMYLKTRTPFDFLWAVSMKKSYWITLLWSASQCVYFVRSKHSFTLYLSTLYLSFVPYRSINSLSLCQNSNTSNHTLVSCTQVLRIFLLGFFILEKWLANQCVFLVRSKHSITPYLFLVLYRSTASQSWYWLNNIESFLCK